MNFELISIMIMLMSFWYWYSAQTVKEIAYANVRNHCRQLQLQMLDDYVALQKLTLKRNRYGKLCLVRTYGFEFSATGDERYQGQVTLMGQQIQAIEMDAYRISEAINF